MKRRTLLATGALSLASPAQAQLKPPANVPVVGFLGANSQKVQEKWTAAFAWRLKELGWIDGRSILVDYHWANGSYDVAPEIMAGFVRRKVAVIVTHAAQNVEAAMKASTTTPIVFAITGDPVAQGLVASLARPGGNVTGLSMQSPDVAGKRIQLLREVMPGLRRLGFLASSASAGLEIELAETRKAAAAQGVEVVMPTIRRAEEVMPAVEALAGRVDALLAQSSPFLNIHRVAINTRALALRLPTSWPSRAFLEGGGLMSYGPDIADLFARAASLVDKILRGAKPADLPVEQPTKWELVLNRNTATALGLTLPMSLVQTADEVIE